MIGASQSRSIITSDPGFVTNRFASSEQVVAGSVSQVDNHEKELEVLTSGLCHQSTEGSGLGTRVRYCRSCKAYIKGLDHHCRAFGNCIGFWFGYEGTILQELQVAAKSGILRKPSLEPTLSENLVVSTILFVILQLVRQVVFVIWHIYCVCFNIRTDEWNAMPNLLPVQGKTSQVLGSGILMTKPFFRMPGSL
nr:palmitoyltransferase SWF1-like [Malus domestica]